MKKIEKYGVFEAVLNCEDVTDLIAGEAVFKRGTAEKRVRLFKNHSGEYMVRFMPQMEGIWSYQIMIGTEERSGKFECTAARGENHGVVHAEGDHFQYQENFRRKLLIHWQNHLLIKYACVSFQNQCLIITMNQIVIHF